MPSTALNNMETPKPKATRKMHKKHSKKTAATGSVDSDGLKQILKDYADNCSVVVSKNKGRHILAKKDFAVGDLILKECPVTSTVNSECATEYCSFCWSLIERNGPKKPEYCPETKYVAYCSAECRDKHKPMHDIELPLLKDDIIARFALKEGSLKVEYYIMAIRAIIGRYLNTKGVQPYLYPTGHYGLLEGLYVNTSIFNKLDRRIFKNAAEIISSILPPFLETPVAEIEHDLAVFNCYQYEITPLSNPDTNALKIPAFGIFPFTWQYFRHSCVPNAHLYASTDGKICIRALQPIAAGEEIFISFIDIYTGRIDRWVQLATTKHSNFFADIGKKKQRIGRCCNCARCKGSLESSPERFFQGFLCRQCGKDVYVARDKDGNVVEDIIFFRDAPSNQANKMKAVTDSSQFPKEATDSASNEVSKDNSKEPESTAAENKDAKAEDGDTELNGQLQNMQLNGELEHISSYKCCNCGHELPALVYQQIETEVQNDYSLSSRCFQEQAFDLAYKIFLQFIQRYEKDLYLIAGVNPLLFHSRLYIMHAAEQAKDYPAALQAARELLQTVDRNGVCPQYSPDRAEIYYKMSTLMSKLAQEKAGKQTKGEVMYVKKMIRDAKEMYTKALEQIKWIYGDDYPVEKLNVPKMPPTSQIMPNGQPRKAV